MAKAATDAQQKAARLGDVAGAQLKSQVANQKGKVASQLVSMSDVLDDLTEQLRREQRTAIADYPETAAHQLRSLSEQLEQADLEQLLTNARRVARERPALFLGGAFAVGVLGARLMKGSASAGQMADSQSRRAESAIRSETAWQQMPGSGLPESELGRTVR